MKKLFKWISNLLFPVPTKEEVLDPCKGVFKQIEEENKKWSINVTGTGIPEISGNTIINRDENGIFFYPLSEKESKELNTIFAEEIEIDKIITPEVQEKISQSVAEEYISKSKEIILDEVKAETINKTKKRNYKKKKIKS